MSNAIIARCSFGYVIFEAVKNKSGFWFCRQQYEGFYGKVWSKWEPVKSITQNADKSVVVFFGKNDSFCQCEFAEERGSKYRLPKDGGICNSVNFPENQVKIFDKYSDNNGAYQAFYIWQDGEMIKSGSNMYDQHCDFNNMTQAELMAY